MLRGKKCPKPGILVTTKAGLLGATTGSCVRQRVLVKLMGADVSAFTRGELTKVPPKAQDRIQAELERGTAMATPRTKRGKSSYEQATGRKHAPYVDSATGAETLPAWVSKGYIRSNPSSTAQTVDVDLTHLPMDGFGDDPWSSPQGEAVKSWLRSAPQGAAASGWIRGQDPTTMSKAQLILELERRKVNGLDPQGYKVNRRLWDLQEWVRATF